MNNVTVFPFSYTIFAAVWVLVEKNIIHNKIIKERYVIIFIAPITLKIFNLGVKRFSTIFFESEKYVQRICFIFLEIDRRIT